MGVALPPGDSRQCLETFLAVTTGCVCVGVPLSSGGEGPGMLLNMLQCTGQPPPQRIVWPQMSLVLRLRTPSLEKTECVLQGRGQGRPLERDI